MKMKKDDRVVDDVYKNLAEALDRLPNGFPPTPSNAEIPFLKKIFSPEEASIASQLGKELESLDVITEKIGIPVEEARGKLTDMAERGLLWLDTTVFDPSHDFDKLIEAENPRFRLAPVLVGIFEGLFGSWDHELIHLFEEYMNDGGAAGIMKPGPGLLRTLPAMEAVKLEQILPYEDVRALIMNPELKKFCAHDCYCRKSRDIHGTRKCEAPLKVCLSFTTLEHADTPPDEKEISREEALEILDHCEETGLVHAVTNIMKGVEYVCNCCGCCCEILRGINEWGSETSMAASNYYAVIDPGKCTGCGICLERCQVHAISEEGEVAVVDRGKCIGCGLCVTGCPEEVAKLKRKPDTEIVHPPVDYAAWERERLHNRGLAE